jgi:Predicted Zn-dependent peptidases
MLKRLIYCVPIAVVVAFTGASAKVDKIPDSPSRIEFKPLNWKVPLGAPYRTVLPNGLVAYIAEDQSLPLVKISGYIRYGSLLDPKGKEGLCSLLANLMRTGGTRKYQADSLDALIDLYALNIRISASETQMQFSFSCLAEYTAIGLDILGEMLFHPAFEEKKVKKTIDLYLEDLYHRFDNPAPILRAAYQKALYAGGANSRLATAKNITGITRNDLIELHQKVLRTENIICAVSGKFIKDTMALRLSIMFPRAGKVLSDSLFPKVSISPSDKVLFVNKKISQSYVQFGLPLFKRPDPDYYAVSVLNMVLGGESFTSRLGTKIRSDEGLTYSIYSNAESNYFYPGTFFIDFFTKSETTSRAISLSLDEVRRIKTSGITAEELEHAKRILIDGFPSMFRSPEDIVENYADNEYLKRPLDHYAAYPDKIKALTVSDIQAMAKKYLDPSAFAFVVVGDTSAIFKSDTVRGFSLRNLRPSKYVVPDSIPYLP